MKIVVCTCVYKSFSYVANVELWSHYLNFQIFDTLGKLSSQSQIFKGMGFQRNPF